MRVVAISLAAFSAIGMTRASDADDAPRRSAELQVLDRFVGTWDFVVTTRPAGGEAVTAKTSETRTWSLGGSFVHFENPQTGAPEAAQFHMLVTYDPATKSYPGVLMTGPSRALVTGIWDKQTQTMTFSGTITDGGSTFVYTNRFLDEDHVETIGVIKGPKGEVIVEQTQKQMRRAKK